MVRDQLLTIILHNYHNTHQCWYSEVSLIYRMVLGMLTCALPFTSESSVSQMGGYNLAEGCKIWVLSKLFCLFVSGDLKVPETHTHCLCYEL